MARFVLQPCHLREGTFAPIKGTTPVVLDWRGLLTALAPSGSYNAKMTLRALRPGTYVGTTKDRRDPKVLRNFVLANPDRSAQVDGVLKKDPEFEERLVDVYRVDEVVWDSVVQEFDTPGPLPQA